MTRGTANSCFESKEMTRLSSSSPVAAMTTSTLREAGSVERAHLAAVSGDEGQVELGPELLHEVDVLVDEKDVVSLRGEVGRDRGSDVPCTADGHLHSGYARRRSSRRGHAGVPEPTDELVQSSSVMTAMCSTSPSCPSSCLDVEAWLSCPGDRHEPARSPVDQFADLLPAHSSGMSSLQQHQPTRRVHPLGGDGFWEHSLEHPVDRPGHRRDGRDAEALVDLGAARVVDPGDHPRHLVGLSCDPSGQDVRVVPARHRGEGARLRRPCGVEGVAVEA